MKPSAYSFRKTLKGPPVLMSQSDVRITINNVICLLNIVIVEEFGIDVQFSDQKLYTTTPLSLRIQNFN